MGMQNGVLKNSIAVHKIKRTATDYGPAILLLGISPVDVLAHMLIDLCTRLFITVLFVTVKNQKQSKSLSIKN